MPLYLSQRNLKEAVDRLAVSSASSRLGDYLVFKRALKLARQAARDAGLNEPSAVVTGTKAPSFVQAIEELALRLPRAWGDPNVIGNPYYIPFGSMRDKTRGYRSKKFPSNGPSVTVAGWQTIPGRPLVLVQDSAPKAFEIGVRTKKELEGFFLVKHAADHFSGELPRLLDTAMWWFRFADLEARFGRPPMPEEMAQAFIEDHDLTELEVSALFGPLGTS